ncbi:acetamidase [Penicillium lividum]|nr:acetamidase [Penicillium lividum]
MATTWEEIAVSKRASITVTIPAEWVLPSTLLPSGKQLDVSKFIAESGWFSDSEIEILKSTASELLPRLAQGSVSSEEINPLTEGLFDEALVTAKALDEHLKSTGKPKGPLHGLPISIKDNFNIKGKDSTQGFTSRVNQPAESHSPIIQLLLDAGAVLYVKTNVPPGMKRPETYNAVFGNTLNPMNRLWSAGGSSGGEGALISFGGSSLGVGSDMVSCVLQVALAVFPLHAVVSTLFVHHPPSQGSIRAVPGPMAKKLEDVILFSKIFADRAPWKYDPDCIPIEWRHVETKASLKLAVISKYELATPQTPAKRALEGAVATLKAAGHKIVEFPITKEEMEAVDISFGLFLADAGNWVKTALGNTGEPVPPDLTFPLEGTPKTLFELHKLHLLRDNLRMKWFKKLNSIEGLDGILIPTTPYSIPEYGGIKYSYTLLANVLDYPATSFPSSYHVDKNIDKPYVDFEPLGPIDKMVQGQYDPELAHGAPVSFQSLGRRLEEKKVLMTDVVSRALRG